MSTTDSTGTFSSGVLIADPVSGYPATPTLVGGVAISSCLELQSTTTALTLPRMTIAERDAIVTKTDGMMIYNDDLDLPECLSNSIWVSEFSSFKLAQITLAQADILALDGTPFQVVAAPLAGTAVIILKATLVNVFNTTAFNTGAAVKIGYETSGVNALTATIAANFVNAAATSVVSLYGANGGAAGNIIAASDMDGQALKMTTTAAFLGGNAASKIEVNIWYTTVAVA